MMQILLVSVAVPVDVDAVEDDTAQLDERLHAMRKIVDLLNDQGPAVDRTRSAERWASASCHVTNTEAPPAWAVLRPARVSRSRWGYLSVRPFGIRTLLMT
jgi:hypothetical protein